MKEYVSRNLIIVAGGIGLIPLRSVIIYALHHRDQYEKIQVFYGSRTPKDLMYVENLKEWQQDKGFECYLTVDQGDHKLERTYRRRRHPFQEARRGNAHGEHNGLHLRAAGHVPVCAGRPQGHGV